MPGAWPARAACSWSCKLTPAAEPDDRVREVAQDETRVHHLGAAVRAAPGSPQLRPGNGAADAPPVVAIRPAVT